MWFITVNLRSSEKIRYVVTSQLNSKAEFIEMYGGNSGAHKLWVGSTNSSMTREAEPAEPLPITSALLNITHSFTVYYQAKNEWQSAENVKLSEH